MTTGDRICHLREQLGMTRAALAKQAAVTPAHISGVEKGKSGVSEPVLRGIAEALAVTPEVLRGEAPMPEEVLHKRLKRAQALTPDTAQETYAALYEEAKAQPIRDTPGWVALRDSPALRLQWSVTDEELERIGAGTFPGVGFATAEEVVSLLLWLRSRGY